MTAREPDPDTQFHALLSEFPPEIGALTATCLTRLRTRFTGCDELVYSYSNSLVVAFGLSERGSEAIVALKVSAQRVQLYLDKSLPDPQRLFEGSGTRVRGVTINAASDLDHGPVRALVEAAIEHSGVVFPNTRSTRVVIKSDSKKRKPRSSGRA